MTCTIGTISNVQIVDVTNNTVTFTTDSKLVGATNGSAAADKRINGTFTCPIADVWQTQGGVTEDGIPFDPCVKLAAGNVGPLYLEERSMQRPGTSAKGSCLIRGCVEPLLADEPEAPIPLKWPNCGGLDDDRGLALVPTGVRVVGYVDGKPPASVNLLDATFALASQDIHWQSTVGIKLHLTSKGFDAFHAPVSNDGKLTIWPTKIEVVGRPASGSGHPATIDVRDQSFAFPLQRLQWSSPGANVSVRATERGCARFGIVSEDVRRAAERIKALRKTDPRAFAAIQLLWQAQRAMTRAQPDGLEIFGPEFAEIIALLRAIDGHRRG